MALKTGRDARDLVRELIERRISADRLLRGDGGKSYLPGGWSTDPEPWSEHPPEVGGYRSDGAFTAAAGAADADVSPAEALGWKDTDPQRYASYCRHSVDLTMKGGTTSGVIYPLAVCELAKTLRIRNVGGASAGAIAAAAAAAAECGRTAPPGDLSTERLTRGHLRAGFLGLADLTAWLAQVDLDRNRPDAHRLAALFRPARSGRGVFRILAAVQRRRLWAVPVLIAAAMRRTGVLAVAVPLTVLLLGWVAAAGLADLQWPTALGWYTTLLAGWAFVLGGALAVALRSEARGPRADRDLLGVSSWAPPAKKPTLAALWSALIVLGVVLVLAVWIRVTGTPGLDSGDAALLSVHSLGTLLASVVAATVVVVAWVKRTQDGYRSTFFGLVSGATETDGAAAAGLDRLAGLPRIDTASRPVVTWLSESLSELAGLPDGEVLRFGHLWFGRDFTVGPPDVEKLRKAAERASARRVNLELITSDASGERPWRFPLPTSDLMVQEHGTALYFRVDDLERAGEENFPRAVADVLRTGERIDARLEVPDGDVSEVVLHRLPEPWDLPVIVPVRMSMSLPGLFKAVRLYRLVRSDEIHDDLGRRLSSPGTDPTPSAKWVAEELWFSDGGATSNFPVHLFDSMLPRWPTFGLNLGRHRPSSPHQDVWLPEDWQARGSPTRPIGEAMLDFLSGLFNTARNWRDNLQAGMPSTRGRVAWVRLWGNEGGTNLFMPAESIAGLALRGALAGARLRERFAPSGPATPLRWDRNRWLRLRVALGNLDDSLARIDEALVLYQDLVEDSAARAAATGGGAFPAGIETYLLNDYAPARGLLNALRGQAAAVAPGLQGPLPHPDLRQVPPV